MGQVQRINEYGTHIKRGKRLKRKKSDMAHNIRYKLAWLKWMLMVLIIWLGYQVYALKNTYGTEYENIAITQQINSVIERTINPNRGNILDRNHQSLAVSTTVYNVILDVRIMVSDDVTKSKPDANNLTKRQKAVKALNEILGIPMETLNEYLALKSDGVPVNDTNWKVIAKGVDRQTVDKLKALNLSAVHYVEDTERTYVHNNLASQLLGFIRGDSDWGLERYYNSYMTGTSGRYFRIYDNSPLPVTELVPAIRGNTLVTTLDLAIQQFADELTTKWCNDLKAQNASIIVMNPNTGEIYAMSVAPSYNLNDPTNFSFINDVNNIDMWTALPENEQYGVLNKIWRNYNVTDAFEPGSIFKPIVLAAALEEGKVSMSDTFTCTGGKLFPGGTFVQCHKTSGHGLQTLEQAVANSCNEAFMEIVARLGKEDFYRYQRDFGFAEYTGIDLPSESNSAPNVYSLAQLSIEINLGTSGIGQGFNVTPIQAITAFSAVINGGNLLKPYVVSQIIDENGKIVMENSRTVQRKVISKGTSDYLRIEMERVISEGTGKGAKIDGYAIGGKTGTGQQGDRTLDEYTLSFIGYFPVENPEYIAIVSVNRPYVPDHNSIPSISPILKSLFEKIIAYKSIPLSYSQAEPSKASALMPDIKGKTVAEATKLLIDKKIDYNLIGGRGSIVSSQKPEAGAIINDQTVAMVFITASNGDSLENVPNLVGMPYEDAKQLLKGLGFNSVEILEEAEDGAGLVYGQIPEAGTQLIKGSYIKIKATTNIK